MSSTVQRKRSQQHEVSFRILRCGVGSEHYGVEMNAVHNIFTVDTHLEQLRGDQENNFWFDTPEGKIHILSLRRHFQINPPRFRWPDELSEAPEALGRIGLAVQFANKRWAILIDSVSRVLQIPQSYFCSMPRLLGSKVLQGAFAGVVRLKENLGAATNTSTMVLTQAEEEEAGQDKEIRRQEFEDETPLKERLMLMLSLPALDPSRHILDLWKTPSADPFSNIPALQEQSAQKPAPITGKTDLLARTKNPGQIITFSLASSSLETQTCALGLSVRQILEIVDPQPLLPMPTLPSWVMGVTERRQQPIVVIDLAAKLGLMPCPKDRRYRLMIVRTMHANEFIGFPVLPDIRVFRATVKYQLWNEEIPYDRQMLFGVFQLQADNVAFPVAFPDLNRMLPG